MTSQLFNGAYIKSLYRGKGKDYRYTNVIFKTPKFLNYMWRLDIWVGINLKLVKYRKHHTVRVNWMFTVCKFKIFF